LLKKHHAYNKHKLEMFTTCTFYPHRDKNGIEVLCTFELTVIETLKLEVLLFLLFIATC
jgi:hypothetical protein